jgi:predicted ATPase
MELATRQNIAQFLAGWEVFRGWARGISGNTTEGLAWIEEGIKNWMSTGARLAVPYYLVLKAEVLYLAPYTSEALQTITEAETLAERFEERWWCAEMHRLRGVFLAALGAYEIQIETSFHEAIRTAACRNLA